jgi:L-fuconolactonase
MTRVIDSHLHVWDLGLSEYAWLGPQHGPIFRTFDPEEAVAELSAAGVDGAVLVQAEDSLRDTEHMLAAGDRFPQFVGVVGWVALDDPRAAAEQLDRWQEHPGFSGVRHLVHNESRADFLDLPAVRASLADLARRGLAFDVPDAWPDHLARVQGLARDLPDLTVVVDHLAKPPRGTAALEQWRRTLEAVAAQPNTVAKVSGLYTDAAPHTVEALEEVWDVALTAFGPDRLMWGSDWPVAVLAGGYAEVTAVLRELIGRLSEDEQSALLGGTATRVYRLS